jgi:hypothetical protein
MYKANEDKRQVHLAHVIRISVAMRWRTAICNMIDFLGVLHISFVKFYN